MRQYSLAQSIPPVVAGFLAAATSPNFPIFVGALLVLLAWVVFITITKQTAKDIVAHVPAAT